MSKGRRQGGSVGVFIVVGVILALIALGALYGVRQVAMNDQTPPMSIDGVTDPADTTDDSSQTKQDHQDTNGQSRDESTSDSITHDQNQAGSNNTTGTGSSTNGSVNSEALPRSGAAENLSALVLALVTTTTVAFIRSLRKA